MPVSKSPSYLMLKGTTWYFRYSVPHSLRKFFNRSEFRLSLKTSSLSLARNRAILLASYFRDIIQELNKNPEINTILDGNKLKKQLITFLTQRLEDDENRRLLRERIDQNIRVPESLASYLAKMQKARRLVLRAFLEWN